METAAISLFISPTQVVQDILVKVEGDIKHEGQGWPPKKEEKKMKKRFIVILASLALTVTGALTVLSAPSANAAPCYSVSGGIGTYYRSHGASSVFGCATTSEIRSGSGSTYHAYQLFQRGRIDWWGGGYNKAYGISGGIWTYYQKGVNPTIFGWPKSDEIRSGSGDSYHAYQLFQGGRIDWWANGVTVSISGGIWQYYQSHGGSAVFGWPMGDEARSQPYYAYYQATQQFQRGIIAAYQHYGKVSTYGISGGIYTCYQRAINTNVYGPNSSPGIPMSGERIITVGNVTSAAQSFGSPGQSSIPKNIVTSNSKGQCFYQ